MVYVFALVGNCLGLLYYYSDGNPNIHFSDEEVYFEVDGEITDFTTVKSYQSTSTFFASPTKTLRCHRTQYSRIILLLTSNGEQAQRVKNR